MILRWLTIVLFFSCICRSWGQEYITSLKHWDMKDGLSHRQVNGIYVDKQGFVWLTTRNGLNRFDGYNFRVYNRENTGLLFENLERLIEDQTGDLWIMGEGHTQENVMLFNPVTNRVRSFQQKTGSAEKVHADFLGIMADNTVFFGRNLDSVFYTWHASFGYRKVRYPVPCRLLAVFPERNCIMVKVTSRQICEVDMHGTIIKQKEVPFIADVIHSDLRGRGAYITDSITRHIFYINDEMEATDVQSLMPGIDSTMNDNIFNIGSDSMIWRQARLYIPGTTLVRDFIAEGVTELHNRIRDKKIAGEGKIWLANDFGLYLLSVSRNKFRRFFYQDPRHFNLNSFRGILADSGKLYACNEYSGVKHANLSTGATVPVRFVPPAPSIGYFAVAKTWEGDLFGISSEYIFVSRRAKPDWTFYNLAREHHKKYYWQIHQVAADSFLLGTHYGLKWFRLSTGQLTKFDQLNRFTELENAIIVHLGRQPDGSFWLCSNTGLYKYQPGQGIIARYSSADTGRYFLPAKEFQHITADSGIYWLATTSGLIKWEPDHGRYRTFVKRDGLSNDNIYAVYNDGHGRLWMSSDYGIMSLEKASGRVKTYLTSSGITHNEFNRASHFMDGAGNIYFGSLNGITAFNPGAFPASWEQQGTALAVTSYQQFNGATNKLEDKTSVLLSSRRIVMEPADLFFTLSFALLNYEDVEQNTYYWKIEGLDTGWNSMKDHVLRLSRLPYGDKLLRIKAQSGDGSWSANELQFTLQVIKPVYLRSWFLVLGTMVVAGIIAAMYTRRVRRLQQENIKLDKVVKEKTMGLELTINDLKESSEQKQILMKEIHHRVKNNLQVISVLLKLQLSKVTDEVARASIEESMSRVSSIALIHQYLYKDEEVTAINIASYTTELSQQIEALYLKPGQAITLKNEIPDMFLDIDTAVPLGIILNELMINSNKYAFSGRSSGSIFVGMQKRSDSYVLSYSDDGPGLPADYSMSRADTLGMTIVKSLAAQLKGTVEYRPAENIFFIVFKDTAMRRQIA